LSAVTAARPGLSAPGPWALLAGACRAAAAGAASKQTTTVSHATLDDAVTQRRAVLNEQDGDVIEVTRDLQCY